MGVDLAEKSPSVDIFALDSKTARNPTIETDLDFALFRLVNTFGRTAKRATLLVFACGSLCLYGHRAIAQGGPSSADQDVAGEIAEIRFIVRPEDGLSDVESFERIDDVFERQMQPARVDRTRLSEILKDHPAVLEAADRLSPEQYRSFLKNRRRLLTTAYWALRLVSWNKNKFADRMSEIDRFVIQSADAIARSRRTGFAVSATGAFGLGLSDYLKAKIKNEKFRAILPASGGFYYVLGVGGGAYIQQTTKKKNHFILEVFVDFDRLKKIHTYAAEVSAAVNWSIPVDDVKWASVEKYDSHYVGILGVIRRGVSHFSYTLITGIAMPPYLPIGMVYTNETRRARVQILKIPWFKFRGDRCENLFLESL